MSGVDGFWTHFGMIMEGFWMYHCTLVKCYLSITNNRKLYKVNRQNEVLMCVFKHLNSLDTESYWTKYSCRWNGQHWGDVGVKISCYKTGCVITIPWTIPLDNYLHVNVQVTVVQVYLSILYSPVGHDNDRGGEEADARHPPEDQPPSRGLQPRALRGQARAGRQRQEVRTLSS